jgi:copper resistance protein B
MKALITVAIALGLSTPAFAQMDHSNMPGMEKPPKPAPVAPDPHAGHEMSTNEVPPPEPAEPMAVEAETPAADPHAGHDMSSPDMTADEEIGSTPAPASPIDHAADALFDPATMAEARKALRHEHGGLSNSLILFNLAEYQARKGVDGYRWEGEGWFGGDINRLVIKTEGEGSFGGSTEQAEFQLLYGRAISPYFNFEAGVRYDIKPDPSRGYAVIGIEGIAPYWFDVGAQLFLSDKGDILARIEGSYDQRITQKLILQPRAELNFAAQDVRANGVGSGLSDIELGLRLRYEIKREFAPYIGVEWAKKIGNTARFARIAGEDADMVNFVAGIRFWF